LLELFLVHLNAKTGPVGNVKVAVDRLVGLLQDGCLHGVRVDGAAGGSTGGCAGGSTGGSAGGSAGGSSGGSSTGVLLPLQPKLRLATSKPPSKQRSAAIEALTRGGKKLADFGITPPGDYALYLKLGRFRDALILDENRRRPSTALGGFIAAYSLQYFHQPN